MDLEEFKAMEPTARVIGEKVAYIQSLTFGRARVNMTTVHDLLEVGDLY